MPVAGMVEADDRGMEARPAEPVRGPEKRPFAPSSGLEYHCRMAWT